MPDEMRNATHNRLRAIVERVFGFSKNWATLSKRFQLSPELQKCCVLTIYQLVAEITNEFPLIR
jgi:hypothetical protein